MNHNALLIRHLGEVRVTNKY